MKGLLMPAMFSVMLGFVDAGGAVGGYLCYSMCITLAGGALMVFLYLWSKDRLDMDEEPKHQMMKADSGEPSEGVADE